MDSAEGLRSRPTFEQARLEYQQVLRDAAKAAGAVAPQTVWDFDDDFFAGESLCAPPLEKIGEAGSGSYTIGGKVAPTDEQWAAVIEAIQAAVRDRGFTREGTIVNRPGQHAAVFAGPYGASMQVSAKLNVTISIKGACFLHAEAHSSR